MSRVIMAHAEKLAEEVKVLTARIHDLESALSSRDGASHPLLQGRDSQRDEIDALYEKGLNEVSDAIGSLSIGSDGQAKYYGETAGSEVWSYPILVCYLDIHLEDSTLEASCPSVDRLLLTLYPAKLAIQEDESYRKNAQRSRPSFGAP